MKAFDTVPHSRLLVKLELYGIRGLAKNWFGDFLANRQQVTRINDSYSDSMQVDYGVPQGSVLGPLLFLIYVNDIFQINVSSKITAFADDTALLNVSHTNAHALQSVENDLKIIHEWFNQNLLTLSISKCNFLHFSLSGNHTPAERVTVHRDACSSFAQCSGTCPYIERTNETRYLGVILDSQLNWKIQTASVANRLRALLCKMYHVRKLVSLQTLKSFYFAMGQSILQYSITCWGGTYFNVIEPLKVLQNKIVKVMTFKTQRSHSLPIYRELGILPTRRLYIYRVLLEFRKNGRHYSDRQVTNYHTRLESRFYVTQPKVSKERLHKSSLYLASKFYNNVPTHIKEIKTLSKFKTHVTKWLLDLDDEVVENLFKILK
jgi:hypothetical protein